MANFGSGIGNMYACVACILKIISIDACFIYTFKVLFVNLLDKNLTDSMYDLIMHFLLTLASHTKLFVRENKSLRSNKLFILVKKSQSMLGLTGFKYLGSG